jgi:RNA polymerase sigma-70 factor (ECF subfamily)
MERAIAAAGETSRSVPTFATADDAFRHWVLPEIEVMLRVARSLTRDPSEAEDLVQDALLRAYRAIEGFDGRYPRAWLLTILRNTHLNRVRKRRPELLDDPELDLDRMSRQETASSVEEDVVGGTLDATIDAALRDLPAKHRQVLALVDMDGLTYREAAQVLGVPVGTVMSRLHRARRRMKDRLVRAGLTPGRRAR